MKDKDKLTDRPETDGDQTLIEPSLALRVAEALPGGVLALNHKGRVIFANKEATLSLRYAKNQILGCTLMEDWDVTDLSGNPMESFRELLGDIVKNAPNFTHIRISGKHSDQNAPLFEMGIRPILRKTGELDFLLASFAAGKTQEHIQQLEERLRKTQRAQSVGRLAGGIAHNLNSILSPVIGYTDMALQNLHPRDPLFNQMKEIRTATERATDLVRQLLAYGRKQTIRLRRLDMSTVVISLETILRQSIQENIEIKFELENPIDPIHADRAQLQQIVVNLALNASEAIPQGGKIFIRTANIKIEEDSANQGIPAGAYVLLQVADTGKGMNSEVLSHVFEPFFTTKEIGEGTGLGLSSVYGIVKQHDGHIRVSSKPGRGSVFRVYFPVSTQHPAPTPRPAVEPVDNAEQKTILVVEDEDSLLRFTCLVLRKMGYTVVDAASGPEALEKARARNGPIHLLLTDVIMPKMNGKELYETLSKSHPEMKILYTSGYPDNVIARHGIIDKGEQLLTKPTTVQQLTEKVKQVLDG